VRIQARVDAHRIGGRYGHDRSTSNGSAVTAAPQGVIAHGTDG
jgi:hypothetical protein